MHATTAEASLQRKTIYFFLALAATAAHGADQALQLEEIVVTAQKKSESLADIPMTVQSISGETFNDFASFDLRDVDRLAAGIAITGGQFDVDIAIRGLGTNLNAAVSPRVTMYWDGSATSQNRSLFTNQFDIARFEILRGPQGTLYGKSSPAGAITIESRSPSMDRYDGYIQQTFAQRGQANTQLAVSLPAIKDKLSFRVAGLYDRQRAQDVENITLDKENSGYTSGGRFVMFWQATEDFDLRLSYNHVRSRSDIDSVVEGNGLIFDQRKAVGDFASTANELSRYTVLNMNWLMPNEWTLSSVSSYQSSYVERFYDSDYSNVPGQNQHVISDVYKAFNTEFRLASVDNEIWNWTGGFYYSDSAGETPVYVDDYRVVAIGLYEPILTKVTGPAINESLDYAIFIHNAFNLTQNSILTLGLRYNLVKRSNEQVFQRDSYRYTESGLDLVNSDAFVGIPLDDQKSSDSAVTGTLKIQHHFSDAVMGYASYDRGWRDGSVNIAGAPQPPGWAAIDAETSDNIELGLKWRMLGGRGLMSLAAYYQLYSDFQYEAGDVTFIDPANSLQLASPVVNVPEVASRGAEAEFNVILIEGWWLNIAASYNNTEFTDAPAVPCTDPGQGLDPTTDPVWSFNTCNLKGEPAGILPEWSGVITSEYAVGLGDTDVQWFLRGLYKAESKRYDNDINEYLGGYAFLDLFSGFRANSWDVSLWVRNVFDRSNKLNVANTPLIPDYSLVGTPGPLADQAFISSGYQWIENQLAPRTVGLTAAYRF